MRLFLIILIAKLLLSGDVLWASEYLLLVLMPVRSKKPDE